MPKFVTNRGVVIETSSERAEKYPVPLTAEESKAPAKKAAAKKPVVKPDDEK